MVLLRCLLRRKHLPMSMLSMSIPSCSTGQGKTQIKPGCGMFTFSFGTWWNPEQGCNPTGQEWFCSSIFYISTDDELSWKKLAESSSRPASLPSYTGEKISRHHVDPVS